MGFSINQCLFIIFILVLIFALSQHMGKCIMNFPLASYLSHITNFISHEEMHEEFPIGLFFHPFIYQLSHPMGKCMKNLSLLCICRFVGSTFTSHGEMYRELLIGYPICPFYHHLSWPFYILELTSHGHISVIWPESSFNIMLYIYIWLRLPIFLEKYDGGPMCFLFNNFQNPTNIKQWINI